ncbi:MAG TPA: rhomboid family intramembrane serine protease [Thermoanaerobaculia bacterium]|nr:rhomboid family intramembrane serine protease [Thermoanaerobaculia bacterium]
MRRLITRAPATAAILTIISAVFFIELATGASQNEELLRSFGAVIPWDEMSANHQYWRLLAGMFLHQGWLHWIANSWALYQLGFLFEMMFGTPRFLLIYFATGLISMIASSVHLPLGGSSIGASGAVLGVLGAFIFSIRRSQWRRERWTRSLMAQLVFWALFNVVLGFQIPQIDNAAHIAGLISGLVLGFLPHREPPPPPGSSVIDVRPYDDGLAFPKNQP